MKSKQHHLSGVLLDDFYEFLSHVSIVLFHSGNFAHDIFQECGKCESHFVVNLRQPNIDLGVFGDVDPLPELDHFALSTEHRVDDILAIGFLIFQGGDASVHFGEVPLDNCHIFAVTDNLEQVFITDEVKSCECSPLGFQIITQCLLNIGKHFAQPLQGLLQRLDVHGFNQVGLG